jgi:hypothetical protein
MMKTRQALTLLLFSGLLFFSSCLKNDPSSHNTTLFYGHQDIPNINYYMPQVLLDSLDKKSSLFFGENPPGFYFDSCCYSKDTTFIIAFMDSCFGKASLTFKNNDESSSTSNTYKVLNKKWKEYCLDTTTTILPIFFDTTFNGSAALDPEVLRHAYIMGNDPYFTLYYYEVRDERHQYQPLNAVILSGECVYTKFPIDTIQITVDTTAVDSIVYRKIPHYLTGVKWGVETMKYFPKDNSAHVALDAELGAGTQPQPGSVTIKEFDTLFIKPYKIR